jgi:hypothetical protein
MKRSKATTIVFTMFNIKVYDEDQDKFFDELEALCRKYATKNGKEWNWTWKGEDI